MKRKVICIVSTVIAFILATAFNLANMIGGAGTSVFGVILSVVFCVCIFVLPSRRRTARSQPSLQVSLFLRRLLQQSDCLCLKIFFPIRWG